MSELEDALAKIRPHKTSPVPHQKAPATLLAALETTFKDQSTERSPAAYFAALLTTLESSVEREKSGGFALGEGDLLPAELYLLALVAPYVPPPVIRANINTLLSLTAPLWPVLNSHAPPLRSQLSLFTAILQALDRSQLDIAAVRQSFASVLQLCVDPRPKVRRKAADLVRDVLATPPTPLLRHPFADRVAEWSLDALAEVNAGGVSKQKGKKPEADSAAIGIHLLALLRPILPFLPSSSLPTLTTSLLTLPRLGNPYLSQSAYHVLSELLSTSSEDDVSPRNVDAHISDVLKAIVSSPPAKAETTFLPAWVQVVGKVMLVYSSSDKEACAHELAKVWKIISPFLDSNDNVVRKETAQALACLAQCISPAMISVAVEDIKPHISDSSIAILHIISQVTKALESLSFSRAIPEILSVISALTLSLRHRINGRVSPTAAEVLLLPLIQKVGDLRIKKNFDHKEAADGVLRTAMSVMGPEVLLRTLPLNLEPTDRTAGKEPRAFMLPLLTIPHPSPMSHFVSYFVPLTERMFDLQQKAEAEGRDSEAKVWSVLVAQIWSGFPGYCHGTLDLQEALTPQFAQMLSQLLYNQPELRTPVLKALNILVQSNVALSTTKSEGSVSTHEDAISVEHAAKNVDFLRSQAESWFAVLFNVFGSIGRNEQGMVGDVISTWASITDEKEMTKTCRKVVDLFKENLAKAVTPTQSHNAQRSVVSTMQDILVLLVPYLPVLEAKSLFDMCLTSEVLTSKDNSVQKRGYKLLCKILERGNVKFEAEQVFGLLEQVADDTAAAAKKDRMILIRVLLAFLPSTSLHIIPSLIPEAVLGTKEPSEKARTAAFDLIVAMGNKMSEGGTVKRSKLDDMEQDTVDEASGSIEEYITMVAGGLAGATPHMISATVTALSRLVFEFKETIPDRMHSEIFTTHLVFLTSTNREIVKSTLGFIKLAIHTLPVDLTRPHLKQLVPALLGWSHDHKNHFKEKVRHIFERMIRRFGWDDVYAHVGEDEAGKVLVNIRKRKERAKRKKNQAGHDDDEEEEAVPKPATGNAFEDVLYGSESEGEESDEDARVGHRSAAAKKDTGARLRVDDDEPMDLLQGTSTRITSGNRNTRRKPGQEAAKFKTDEDTGKIVIDDASDSDAEDDVKASQDVAGTAYRESITSVDGFTRGPNGRIKFNKDTKKRRREEVDAAGDVDMVDATAVAQKPPKRRADVKLGKEFKAKNAGGDVKKGAVDPYAYLPLAQAAKKSGKGRGRVTLTGKR